MDNEYADEPFENYPTTATTFHIHSPTAPQTPPEFAAETPEKVPLTPSDESEVDHVEFLPHFRTPEGIPDKAYYLRELERDETDDEEGLS